MPITTNSPTATELLAEMRARTPQMVEQLGAFVNLESPSLNVDQLQRSAEYLAGLFASVTGKAAQIIPSESGPHVHWKGSDETKVQIVGHHDTVFPVGTTATRPFSIDGDVARGPGVFDMKAGIVQAIHGLSAIRDSYHVEMLITADEEVGSYASRALIEARARATGAVLVLEPSADGGALTKSVIAFDFLALTPGVISTTTIFFARSGRIPANATVVRPPSDIP
ncbi:MAG: M20/M25/M40 family metallo-hydrolase, partial [Actinomycetota bacterium]